MLALSLANAADAVAAEPARAASDSEPDERLEIVVVTGVRIGEEFVLQPGHVAHTGPDNSELLRLFPGANRNANGPLSRISQYRGLFGAQNSVTVDGGGYTPDCPNWMDTPLSSVPQSMTESVTLYRGLASVRDQPEGLGGAIDIQSRRGDFAEGDGCGIVHLRAGLRLVQRFNLDLGIENVADTVYQDHLGGYNRVRGGRRAG